MFVKIIKISGIIVGLLLIVGFTFLHWILPSKLESSMNIVTPHSPYQIRPEVQEFHNQLFIADLHSDSLLWKRNLLEESDIGHMDLPRLIKGNVALQVFSATTKSPSGQNYDSNSADSDNITSLAMAQLWPMVTWFSIFERAKYQLSKLHHFAAKSEGKLLVLKNKKDMQAFLSQRLQGEKVVAAIYLIEGAHPFEGELEKLDQLYDDGLRITGLTHFFDNSIGGSLHGISGEGLSSFGKKLIKRANKRNLIIDIAHASPKMVEDVLRLSTKPVILSHGGLKGHCDSSRNLEDTLMQAVAKKDGIIGVGYWDGAICDFTPQGVVNSIRYAIDLLGVDHVALGSDYDGTTEVQFDTSELAILTQTMLDSRFTKSEIRKVMGENVMYFFLEQLP
ncbi:MAG: membrane dipeptidase [Flavobacterium sp.]